MVLFDQVADAPVGKDLSAKLKIAKLDVTGS